MPDLAKSTELIPFMQRSIGDERKNTVNARDVYAFLGFSGEQYNRWIDRAIKNAGLIENIDFVIYDQPVINSGRGRPAIEHHLTFDAAKHVGMMSNADKGKELRSYFIEVEKRAASRTLAPTTANVALLLAQAVVEIEQRLLASETQTSKNTEAIKALEERDDRYTIREYVLKYELGRKMPEIYWPKYSAYLKKYCRDHGKSVIPRRVYDRPWPTERAYLESVIRATLIPWLFRRNGQKEL